MTLSELDLGHSRAVVVGDLMLDCNVWGATDRVSPEAPVVVVRVESRTNRPGGAANTAANMASLGAQVSVVGAVGADAEATLLTDSLLSLGLDVSGLIVSADRPTTTKTRFYAQNQQLLRTDTESTAPLTDDIRSQVVAHALAQIDQVDVVVLSDYAKGVMSESVCAEVIGAARAAGRPVLVDPKGRNYLKYRGASVITPNLEELRRAVNADLHSDDDVIAAGRDLATELGEDTVILVTRGADGMTLIDGAGTHHIPTAARAVFDVTGAGDTVLATLGVALAAGADIRSAAELANRAAAIVVGRVGTAVVTRDELLGHP